MKNVHERPTRLEILYLIHQYNHYHPQDYIKVATPTAAELFEIKKIDKSDDTEYVLEIDNISRYLWDSKQFYARRGECKHSLSMWKKLVESAKDFLQIAEARKRKAEAGEREWRGGEEDREEAALVGKIEVRARKDEGRATRGIEYGTERHPRFTTKKSRENLQLTPLPPMYEVKAPSPRLHAATMKLQKEKPPPQQQPNNSMAMVRFRNSDLDYLPSPQSNAIQVYKRAELNALLDHGGENLPRPVLKPALKKVADTRQVDWNNAMKTTQHFMVDDDLESVDTLVRNRNEKQIDAFIKGQRLASEVRKY
jgi:hypothetical protein